VRHPAAALALLLACVSAVPAESAPGQPRLIVLLTIDQGRGDYLDRFAPALTGGLKRLMDQGVQFRDAHQNHANTVTAAGHAALSTGRYPTHSGMVGNEWFDRVARRQVYCVEDEQAPPLRPQGAVGGITAGRSPRNLLSDTFADWLKREHPTAKVFSIGGKDRSAVLMGGHAADGAYWYDARNGHWITTRFYAEAYPDWVARFHAERAVDDYFGETWTPLPVNDEALVAMEIAAGTFDHAFGRGRLAPDRRYYTSIYNSPILDAQSFALAKRAIVAESLGQDDVPDILALSLASADTVGHDYGPNSREVLDTILRIDRELDELLDLLDATIGLDEVAFSLSADHGVAPLPEFEAARGRTGTRASGEDFACVQRAGRAFIDAFGEAPWFLAPLTFDPDALAREGRTAEEVETFLARELSRCAAVERVWTRTELKQAPEDRGSSMASLYRHSMRDDRGPDLFVQQRPGHLDGARGTTHGSPHRYDTHVVALLRWPGGTKDVVTERVHTVDLPVTLATLMGIPIPQDVDGVDRSSSLSLKTEP